MPRELLWPAARCLQVMLKRKIHRLPVVDDEGKLIGWVARRGAGAGTGAAAGAGRDGAGAVGRQRPAAAGHGCAGCPAHDNCRARLSRLATPPPPARSSAPPRSIVSRTDVFNPLMRAQATGSMDAIGSAEGSAELQVRAPLRRAALRALRWERRSGPHKSAAAAGVDLCWVHAGRVQAGCHGDSYSAPSCRLAGQQPADLHTKPSRPAFSWPPAARS